MKKIFAVLTCLLLTASTISWAADNNMAAMDQSMQVAPQAMDNQGPSDKPMDGKMNPDHRSQQQMHHKQRQERRLKQREKRQEQREKRQKHRLEQRQAHQKQRQDRREQQQAQAGQ